MAAKQERDLRRNDEGMTKQSDLLGTLESVSVVLQTVSYMQRRLSTLLSLKRLLSTLPEVQRDYENRAFFQRTLLTANIVEVSPPRPETK